MVRDDLHCHGTHYSYLWGHSGATGDHDQSKRGVFIGTDQLYQATVTSSELPSHTIGPPLGQALTRNDPPRSVFTANMIGTTYNGKAGVWRKAVGAPTTLLLYELQPLADPPADVATIWAVHAGGTGAVAFHALMNDSKQALLGYKDSSVFKIAAKGDTVQTGSGLKTIQIYFRPNFPTLRYNHALCGGSRLTQALVPRIDGSSSATTNEEGHSTIRVLLSV